MTPVLPRHLADHVLISRMAKALRPLGDLDNRIRRLRAYAFGWIDIEDAKRLDAFALTAELRRREVVQSKRRNAA